MQITAIKYFCDVCNKEMTLSQSVAGSVVLENLDQDIPKFNDVCKDCFNHIYKCIISIGVSK